MKFVEPSPVERKNELYVAYLSAFYDTPLFLEWYCCFQDDFFLFLSISAGRIEPVPEIDKLNKLKKEMDIYYDLEEKTVEEVSDYYEESQTEIEKIRDRVARRLDLSDLDIDTKLYQRSFDEFINKI